MGTIAYFCLEYAIEDNLPIYAGGLGVLAGDLVLEAGSLGLDFVAIGLFYSHGFSESTEINPATGGFSIEPFTIPVEVGNQEIAVRILSKQFGSAKLFLLDAGEITKYLYGPDQSTMFRQQLVLGIGGVRLLRKLNIKPSVYHLNEGHTAMAILELAREANWDFAGIADSVVATKHTIFTGAGLHLTRQQMRPALELFIQKYQLDFDNFFARGTHAKHPEIFACTNFLLKNAHKQNGVSHLHTVMEKTVHPNSKLVPITNGIHVARWDQFSKRQKNQELTVVWARRLASYKRPDLLFSDMNRLKKITTDPSRPVKFIISGKVNPTDQAGAELENRVTTLIRQAGLEDRIDFTVNYSLPVAKKLVASADVWLNTPIPGQEACGTSGMKAGLNGALMLSTNDGWMAEVDWHDLGWILPEENISEALYSVIEREIAPMYYTDKATWRQRSIRTRSLVLDYFNTGRVLQEYQEKLYRLL